MLLIFVTKIYKTGVYILFVVSNFLTYEEILVAVILHFSCLRLATMRPKRLQDVSGAKKKRDTGSNTNYVIFPQ